MWRNVDKPILSGNINKFKGELTASEIEIFEIVAGDMLKKLGYTLEATPINKNFTVEKIAEFKVQEELNQQKIIAKADKDDLKRREGHMNFLREIKSRNNSAIL